MWSKSVEWEERQWDMGEEMGSIEPEPSIMGILDVFIAWFC